MNYVRINLSKKSGICSSKVLKRSDFFVPSLEIQLRPPYHSEARYSGTYYMKCVQQLFWPFAHISKMNYTKVLGKCLSTTCPKKSLGKCHNFSLGGETSSGCGYCGCSEGAHQLCWTHSTRQPSTTTCPPNSCYSNSTKNSCRRAKTSSKGSAYCGVKENFRDCTECPHKKIKSEEEISY